MKKYLVLISVIAVLSFAVTAFALHEVPSQEYTPSIVKTAAKSQIELGGELRIRGEATRNLDDFNTDAKPSDNAQKYDQRVRLSLKATVSPNTFGFVELETGDNAHDTYTWADASNAMNNKRGTMSIRQAYISTNLGKVATLKAGHMLLALGNNLFFDHTKFGDDALLLSIPAGDGELTLISIKLAEGTTTQNDDLDAYVVAYGMPIGNANFSADLTYLNGHSKSIDATNPRGFDKGTKLYNLGLRANADLGSVKVKGDVEIQRGTDKTSAPDSFGNEEVKYKGYAVMLGAEANVGPVSVRGNAAYGSGDKLDSSNDSGEKNEGFQTFLSDTQYYTYIYDYKVVTAKNAASKHTGLNNTWYLNAGVTAKPMPDLKLSGDLYYLKAVKSVDNVNEDMDSRKIGVELDAKAEYQIDTNLVYFVEAGYLWAGDFYKNVVGADEDPDNPYSVRHGLLLKF
ncbi:MAG: alginate export family protein [Nitrospirae bacterium]|nr:alginate export family protein [Nitrospirota bacterium]